MRADRRAGLVSLRAAAEGVLHFVLPLLVLSTASPRAAAQGPAASGGVAELVCDLEPLSVRGVNYYPRETAWSGMWTKTPPTVWDRDMALAASLGCNTVRTFLQFGPHIEMAGLIRPDGGVTPAYLEKSNRLLAAAWRHGIRVIVCFEFSQAWLARSGSEAPWPRAIEEIIRAHRDDGRVLMWDLMNEPESDEKWNDATRAYLRAALPLVDRLDSRHPNTVGLTWRVDRLLETGLPDVVQYHEYAGKEILFVEGPGRVVETIRRLRKSAGAGRPVLIGEFGMSTARDPLHGVAPELRERIGVAPGTEAEQLKLCEVVLSGAERAGAAGVLAWCLHDYPIGNPDESHFGLVRADGTPKPAALLLRDTFARWSRK